MNGIKKLIREQPTILMGAIRQTLLAVVLLGLRLDESQIVAIMLAVESILTAINWAMVTPTAKFDAAVNKEAENIASEIVRDHAPLTEEEIEKLERQIARLNADFKAERQRGT